ncbi:MAG: hypothetical protein ACR2LM_06520 [Pyrinomonadaceae bacterium]
MEERRKKMIGRERPRERGAALVTTLLISMLLLAAGGMLLVTTSSTGINTFDASAETQAYYGAEAGIQATLNVLRGNVMPNPLFVANPAGGVATENKITFRKALSKSTSNLASDPASADARLSRWITYNSTYTDRVTLSPGYNPINGVAYKVKVTDPDNTPAAAVPSRLQIDSTGFGPRGALKQLSMLVVADGLNIPIPAAIVMRGHDDHVTPMTLQLGASASKTYSGVDTAGLAPQKPVLAVSNHDVPFAETAYSGRPGSLSDPKYNILHLVTTGEPAPAGPLRVTPPWFLDTAAAARTFLVMAEDLARKKGRVVSSLDGPVGSLAQPEFVFVDGNCKLDGGAGLVVVTGDLTMAPAGPDFHGIILVLGKGTVNKTGGGNRTIFGSIMVAHFNRSSGNFLDPFFNYGAGAGNSSIRYDSSAISNALFLTAPLVVGVAEK